LRGLDKYELEQVKLKAIENDNHLNHHMPSDVGTDILDKTFLSNAERDAIFLDILGIRLDSAVKQAIIETLRNMSKEGDSSVSAL
jgi:hypothetical protein